MKRVKNLTVMLTAAVLVLLFTCIPLKASAAPVTYTVKYMEDTQDWRYRTDSSEFEDPEYYKEVESIPLQDGDVVAVYCDVSVSDDPKLNLGSARLSNLTVTAGPSFLVITSGDIDECFLLAGSGCSINGNVSTAYVYDTVTCNFNKNVGELRLVSSEEDAHSNIGCSGTVGHFSHIDYENNLHDYNLYNFAANSFSLQDGILQTPESQYSQTPSQATAPQPQQTTAPQPQQPSGASSAPASSGDYDSVPKTGSSSVAPWLVCCIVLCGAGSLALVRKTRS